MHRGIEFDQHLVHSMHLYKYPKVYKLCHKIALCGVIKEKGIFILVSCQVNMWISRVEYSWISILGGLVS